MTVKELKMMLNDMPDDAILLTRSALDVSEFEQATAREMTVVSVRGRIMLPRWAYRKHRKTPGFSYGDIRRSETKFLLKG